MWTQKGHKSEKKFHFLPALLHECALDCSTCFFFIIIIFVQSFMKIYEKVSLLLGFVLFWWRWRTAQKVS